MNKYCNIVRDLLPLYAENMLSPDSQEYVEEHLKECPECTAELQKMKSSNIETAVHQESDKGLTEETIPLKKVKKKLGKKRIINICASVVLTIAVVFGYFMLRPVSIDYGSSKIYSHSEMDAAVTVIKIDFIKMTGCKLFSLSYAGDERCQKELEYFNRDRCSGTEYTECIVFNSVFRSPVVGGGAWEANQLYYWSWILAKEGNGSWVVLSKGNA